VVTFSSAEATLAQFLKERRSMSMKIVKSQTTERSIARIETLVKQIDYGEKNRADATNPGHGSLN